MAEDNTVIEAPEETTVAPETLVAPEESSVEQPEGKDESKEEAKPEINAVIPEWRFKQVIKEKNELKRKLKELDKPAQESPKASDNSAPVWEKYQDEGKSVEEFNSDWVRHFAKDVLKQEREAESRKKDTDSYEERLVNADVNLQKQAYQAKVKYPDWDKVMEKASALNSMHFSDKIELSLKESDIAGDLGYYLAANPEESYKLQTLPEEKALMYIGRIEAKLQAGISQPGPKLTKAEPPVNPLSGGGKAPSSFRDDMSLSEYLALYPPD